MKVCDYIAKFLVKQGITDVFFVDGSAAAAMQVAISENPELKYWIPRHEQGGAFAVDGYFKASGKMACMIATSGPGGQNLLNGIAASWYDSIPALYITGNINSKFMKPNDEIRQHGFQENDIVSMAKPITKFAHQVLRPDDIRFFLEKAIDIASRNRPGPVLLDIPMDIQKAEIDETNLVDYCWHGNVAPVENLDEVCKSIVAAKRPLVLFGGGVRLDYSVYYAREFIEKYKLPYCVTWNMIDFGYKGDPYYVGRVGTFGGDGRNFAIQNCDLLISIGSRISGRITGGMIETFARGAKKIIVDIDDKELKHQQVKGDINIACSAQEFFTALKCNKTKIESHSDIADWINRCSYWRDKYKVFDKEKFKEHWNDDSVYPYYFVNELSRVAPSDSIIIPEAGGNCVVMSQGWVTKRGQRFFSNNGNSSLGYSLPAAIGASIAIPDRPVIAVCGDGGVQFNIQEFGMLANYNLPVKVFIFNNAAYGITKAYRDTNFNSNYAGVDAEHGQTNPDFSLIAKAYDIVYKKIDRNWDVVDVLNEIDWDSGPEIIEVNMKGHYDYHPKLGWRQPIEDQYPFLPRDEFVSNMIIEPHESWRNPQYP